MADSYEKLCEDLVRALTKDNVDLVQRYLALRNGKPVERQVVEPGSTRTVQEIGPSQPGSTNGLDLGAAVKRAEIPTGAGVLSQPAGEADLF